MIGERIHSYEINAHLGQGGMGNVYRATDVMLGREVALKMLHPQLTVQTQFLERFKKEARVLAQLLHPNIAVIYNFIEQGGNHFMVMEYVEGTSLDELLKKYGTLPASFVVPVFIQALEGLQHAHRKNIFHRDIKPSNLMITPEGTLKLMDFGIAKVAGEQKMTQVNKIVGTIEFMAPELIEGKDASFSSDIYSMGATLYELVSGKLPFISDTDFNLMQAILKKKAVAPDKINSQVPQKLSDIIIKAMDKNPANRFPDARAFQQALIAAFPSYREIDMRALQSVTQVAFSGAASRAITRPNNNAYRADAMETRMETTAGRFAFLQNKFQYLLSNRRNKLIAGLLLLFLLLTVVVISVFTGGKKNEKELVSQNDTVKIQEVVPVSEKQSFASGGNGSAEGIPVSTPGMNQPGGIIVPDMNDKEFGNQPSKPKEEKPRREKKNEAAVPEQKPEVQENVTKPVTQPTTKRDVYISDPRVEVNLVLSSNPDMNQKQKSAQRVTFTVTRPVIYKGETIIRQGAVASGSLTIGRVMTDIEIENVEAANGKRIPLKSAKAHGKRADVENNKSYQAYLLPGTNIRF